jgi:hypothetical protein
VPDAEEVQRAQRPVHQQGMYKPTMYIPKSLKERELSQSKHPEGHT